MGIMVGIGTVLADDPMLNTRLSDGKDPVRIICDSKLRIPLDSKICKTGSQIRTIVACAMENREKIEELEKRGIQVLVLPAAEGRVDLPALMRELGRQKIDSVLLEGGGTLNDSALRSGIVHEVKAFVAPKIFGGKTSQTPVAGMGVEIPAESIRLKLRSVTSVGEDLLLEYILRDYEEAMNGALDIGRKE